jgi:2,5-diketo-D-gluconate reductase A
MTETNVPTVELNNGTRIPQLGFGVFRVDPARTAEIAGDAIDVGYRHIDTAAGYRNEKGVGEAVRSSGVAREDLWITTKLANGDQEHPDDAFQASLDALGLADAREGHLRRRVEVAHRHRRIRARQVDRRLELPD